MQMLFKWLKLLKLKDTLVMKITKITYCNLPKFYNALKYKISLSHKAKNEAYFFCVYVICPVFSLAHL